MNPASLFITGTDTGVGKTFVTALLAMRLRDAGVDAGVMKPFASGCIRGTNGLESEDALWLRQVLELDDELELINPIRLEEPLTPLTAAERAGESTLGWIVAVREAYQQLRQRHDIVLVEGVGGLLAPIMRAGDDFFTCAELVGVLGLPVVVVARRVLGTINHTVLTCRYPLNKPAHFTGLIFCDSTPIEPEDVAAQTSPALIEEMTGVASWGEIPFSTTQETSQLRALSKLIEPKL